MNIDMAERLHVAWKSVESQKVCVRVIEYGLSHYEIWLDEIDVSDIAKKDCNVIGSQINRLFKLELIEPTGRFRKSTRDASSGRKIFSWKIKSRALAETFLKRNGVQIFKEDLFA